MRLIDADALKNTIKNMPNDYYCDLCIGDALKEIDNAPTVDAAPVVRGEWRQGKEFSTYPRVPFISTAYYCSNCEGEAYWDTDYGQQLFGFCPNCGARMDGDKHE